MSCPRCGGVLAVELRAAMFELVCGMAVIQGRYCHCDDDEGSAQAKLLREEHGALPEGSDEPPTSKERTS